MSPDNQSDPVEVMAREMVRVALADSLLRAAEATAAADHPARIAATVRSDMLKAHEVVMEEARKLARSALAAAEAADLVMVERDLIEALMLQVQVQMDWITNHAPEIKKHDEYMGDVQVARAVFVEAKRALTPQEKEQTK